MDSVFDATSGARTDLGNTVGDIYITSDTTFTWNGTKWLTLSSEDVDSVKEVRTYVGDEKMGDFAVESDTTFIYDGSSWLVASVKNTAKMDSVNTGSLGDRKDGSTMGDIYITPDTSYTWDGAEWQVLSVLSVEVVDSFQVFVSLDGGTIKTAIDIKAANLEDFRNKFVALAPADRQYTGGATTGVSLYYPAAWGDFSYSIIYSGNKISLTNGIDVIPVGAGTTLGVVPDTYDTTAANPYKQIKISSRNRIVQID